jgi:hypothetical protein
MGKLLSRSIKMQNGGPTTATINFSVGMLTNWYKNGIFQATLPFGSSSATVNAGDTFYVEAAVDFDQANIDYSLNGSFVTTYSGYEYAVTATFTAVAGNTYAFGTYPGF